MPLQNREIITLIFYDFETTDLEKKVPTELSLVVVRLDNFLRDNVNKQPRVLGKLTLPFNPFQPIHPKVIS